MDLFNFGGPDKRQEYWEQLYRNVFATPEGKKVLGDILLTGHFGVPLTNDVERIEYNFAVTIARFAGVMDEVERITGITAASEGK